jgi:hypothetical protein
MTRARWDAADHTAKGTNTLLRAHALGDVGAGEYLATMHEDDLAVRVLALGLLASEQSTYEADATAIHDAIARIRRARDEADDGGSWLADWFRRRVKALRAEEREARALAAAELAEPALSDISIEGLARAARDARAARCETIRVMGSWVLRARVARHISDELWGAKVALVERDGLPPHLLVERDEGIVRSRYRLALAYEPATRVG